MTVENRYEALAGADPGALEMLADEILVSGTPVSVTAGPESVSAPVRVTLPGAADTTVVLGHVALTRCTVLVGGTRGDGIRAGYDVVGAVAAAICDAECERGGKLAARVADLCGATNRRRVRNAGERARLVAMTRLDQS
jgi:alpha-D-ribose 1-methylphosphonate 5-triphosphate synthase subunit PhnG